MIAKNAKELNYFRPSFAKIVTIDRPVNIHKKSSLSKYQLKTLRKFGINLSHKNTEADALKILRNKSGLGLKSFKTEKPKKGTKEYYLSKIMAKVNHHKIKKTEIEDEKETKENI